MNPGPPPPVQTTSDQPARCLRCSYVLEGLHSSACPECGRAFNLRDPSTFTRKAPLLGWVFWIPGLTLAIGGGLLMALVVLGLGNWGWAMWAGVPFSAAAMLTYRFRSRWVFLPLLLVLLGSGLIVGMFAMDMVGLFCGLTLGLVMTLPALIGATAGVILRASLKRSRFSQRSWLPVIGLLLLPVGIAMIEGPPAAFEARSVSTTQTINAAPETVWDKLVFYEQAERPRPLLLRIGLPTPITTDGAVARIGDVTRCIYNTGHITKRVTELDRARRLGFVVIEQDIHFEHDVRLVSGRFVLEPTDDGGTRITLTTVYEPLVAPRFAWQPIETVSVRTLHEHVIEDVRRRAVAADRTLTMAEQHDADRH